MKKYILILSLIFISTKSFTKELDLGMHKIIFPNKFNVINWNYTSFGSSFCQEFSTCFGLIDNKALEIVNQVEAGKNFEEIKVIKPIITKYNKMIDSFSETKVKSLFKTTKNILKKNNSGTFFTYFRTDENINDNDILSEYGINIDEIRDMSSLELQEFSNEIKNEITSGKDYYMFMDGLFINFKKFTVSKYSNNKPYLKINGDITYLLTSSKIKLGNIAYYISEIDDKLFVMDGYCVVNCKTFFSDFDQIIDDSFKSKNKSIKIDSSNKDIDFINQIQDLNELYKSGVLSKEEFEKAKKKILN